MKLTQVEEVHDLMEVMTGSPMHGEWTELKQKHTLSGDGDGPKLIEDVTEEAGGARLTSKVSTDLYNATGLTSLHADCRRCRQRSSI